MGFGEMLISIFSPQPEVERRDTPEKLDDTAARPAELPKGIKPQPKFGNEQRPAVDKPADNSTTPWDAVKKRLAPGLAQTTKDGFLEQKLSTQEQKIEFSKILSEKIPSLKDNQAKCEALAGVLAELPSGESAGNLIRGLLSIKAEPKNAKDAQTLALISNQLADLRKGDNSPETKVRHKTLMSDLIQTSGLSKKHADIAVGVLDRIPAANQANVIQLALGLAQRKDVDLLKTLAGDKKLLAEKSGLSPEAADQARKDIIKAGFEHLQASGNKDFTGALAVLGKVTGPDGKINLKEVQEQLAKNILENPKTPEELAQRNEAHTKREAALQKGIKDAAPENVRNEINKKLRESVLAQWFPGMAMKKANKAYAKALKAINSWQPGAVAGRGSKNKIAREVYAQMNKAHGENQSRSIDEMKKAVTKEVESQLVAKFTPKVVDDLNNLAKLMKAGDIELPKQVQPIRASHLRGLEKLDIAIF